MASSNEQPVTLLLVGRTGNGKSSTGNSILGERVFTPRTSNASVTYDIKDKSTTVKNTLITVVDGPGIGDAEPGHDEEHVMALLKAMENAFEHCSKNFTALLIVLKYGVRFTKQEQDALTTIKSIFGPDVVKNHGVIVMTHGDSFEMDMEDEDFMNTFEDWCKEQTGDVKKVFEECEYRCVSFNNRSKEQQKLDTQRDILMSMVNKIQSRGGNYTEKDFSGADGSRKKLTVMSRLPKLKTETKETVDKITSSLNEISDAGDYGSTTVSDKLQQLQCEIDKHKKHLEDKDEGTGSVEQLMAEVKLMVMRIETLIKINELQQKELQSPEEQAELQRSIDYIYEEEKKASENTFTRFMRGLASILDSARWWIPQWPWGESDVPTDAESQKNRESYTSETGRDNSDNIGFGDEEGDFLHVNKSNTSSHS